MSVFLLYLLKRQHCTDSVNPSCYESPSNVHPASTKPTVCKMQSSGKEANEKTKTKKNTARVLPSRKNLNPKTATEKKSTSRDVIDTGSAQAHIARKIATAQKKGGTNRQPTNNA